MTHELKILPIYFRKVLSYDKTFEVRKNDRDFKIGDEVILLEFDGFYYTGRIIKVKITYILDNFEGLSDGYIAFSFIILNIN